MEKITHIEKIEIEGLWGKYQIDWHLNPDVNILAGINGSGKSTVLNLIAGVLQGGYFVGNVDNLVTEVNIVFNHNAIRYVSMPTRRFDGEKLENIQPENLEDIIKVSRISTFEQPIKTSHDTQKKYLPEKIKTDLDFQLFELQRVYLSYQINLGKRVEQVFLESDYIDIKTKREEIYGKKALFIKTINQFFAETGKNFESAQDNEIVFRQDDKILTPYQLSAGEKQLLIIFLSVLVQDNQFYIFLLDEPEVSLHVEWQEELIKVIRSLNNNAQVIMATHSPSLVMSGWMDKITNMEDITTWEK
ncbi:MAG: ATP-binding protein [Candidatus Parabeggiatoa sp. nov. 1]|nr:MAG: ATP-binding protein [Gammaproteobacteria bacterium]